MKEIVTQLSLREKRLLYVLMCFLIIVAGWFFVITPSIDSYQTASMDYENAVSKKISLEKQLNDYLAAPALLETKKGHYNDIIGKYNPILDNEKIDRLLTTAFLAHGLKPISLAITGADDATNNKANESTIKEDTEGSANIKQANVSVSVNGTLTQVSDIVGYINKMKGIEVLSLQFADKEKTNTTLNIAVYMVDK